MSSRAHIVLVPGFAGFDALGQIQYYAGTTDVFREWLGASAQHESVHDAVLHYFDNLPSGKVKTRAKRLRTFLAKRVTRNEFQRGDSIALVGHSTGGLDIRQLIADLSAAPDELLYVDGHAKAQAEAPSAASTQPPLTAGALLAQIERVVFISTPHFGSNLADNIARHSLAARAAIHVGRLGLALARVLPRFAIDRAGDLTKLDAALAMLDALREADPRNFARDDSGKADALEAYGQLSLFLTHMVSDFGVIGDLVTERKDAAPRVDDLGWPSTIATRSYATISHRPSKRDKPGTTDVVYKAFHFLATRGRFSSETAPIADWLSTEHPLGDIAIDDAASDGVVNTRSMYWRHGGATKLVAADHGDVIGHYRLARVGLDKDGRPPRGRRHHGYDFFKSGTQFGERTFRQLWQEIFTFCARGEVSAGKPDSRTEATRGANGPRPPN
jgi:hypothetical protein